MSQKVMPFKGTKNKNACKKNKIYSCHVKKSSVFCHALRLMAFISSGFVYNRTKRDGWKTHVTWNIHTQIMHYH